MTIVSQAKEQLDGKRVSAMTDGIVAAVSLAALVLLAILLQPDGSDTDDAAPELREDTPAAAAVTPEVDPLDGSAATSSTTTTAAVPDSSTTTTVVVPDSSTTTTVVVPDSSTTTTVVVPAVPECDPDGDGETELGPGEGCQYTVIGSIEEGSIEVEPNSSLLDVEASADDTELMVQAADDAMPGDTFTVSYQLAGESLDLEITIVDRP